MYKPFPNGWFMTFFYPHYMDSDLDSLRWLDSFPRAKLVVVMARVPKSLALSPLRVSLLPLPSGYHLLRFWCQLFSMSLPCGQRIAFFRPGRWVCKARLADCSSASDLFTFLWIMANIEVHQIFRRRTWAMVKNCRQEVIQILHITSRWLQRVSCQMGWNMMEPQVRESLVAGAIVGRDGPMLQVLPVDALTRPPWQAGKSQWRMAFSMGKTCINVWTPMKMMGVSLIYTIYISIYNNISMIHQMMMTHQMRKGQEFFGNLQWEMRLAVRSCTQPGMVIQVDRRCEYEPTGGWRDGRHHLVLSRMEAERKTCLKRRHFASDRSRWKKGHNHTVAVLLGHLNRTDGSFYRGCLEMGKCQTGHFNG